MFRNTASVSAFNNNMSLGDLILYRLAKNWPSPMAKQNDKLGDGHGTDEYALAYAQHQYGIKVRGGVQLEMAGLDVLEIGCGHGGISCYLAIAAGAQSVTGIDLNVKHLAYAEQFVRQTARRFGDAYQPPVKFLEMNANAMTFPDASFDMVIADNAFEHFTEPETVMREAHRVLRPGGRLLVPIFSSIYSKYGLHLKHGLKLPWANLFFSERTIVKTMRRLAQHNPQIWEDYPGLAGAPQKVRDLRRYKDLNDITFAKFKAMARRTNFEIESFRPLATVVGMMLGRTPVLKRSVLADIFSIGASACLRKKS